MKTSMVLARDLFGVIGVNGDLPWHCPADLALFKDLTHGKAIIMGSKTWESLPIKPLPGRVNIVITNDVTKITGADAVVNSVERAIEAAKLFEHKATAMVFIGGASIYEQVLGYVDEVHVSEMNLIAASNEGDDVTLFPHDLEDMDFVLVSRTPFHESETGKFLFTHDHYARPQ